MTTALPPHVLHSRTPLSPLAALSDIDAFLTTANDTAAYRPDSMLSERGPISSSTSGHPNLVLHHLQRIKLGLEGVRVGAAEIEEDVVIEKARVDEDGAGRKRKRDDSGPMVKTQRVVRRDSVPLVSATNEEDAEPTLQTTEEQGGEWEDKDDYELAQDEEVVDMNAERDPAGAVEQDADAKDVTETQPGMEVKLPLQDSEETIEKTVVDKEERKRLKKMKQKQEKLKAENEGKARGKKEKTKKPAVKT